MIFIKYQKYYLYLLIEITCWKQNRIDDKAILHIMKKAFYMLLNKSQKNFNGFNFVIENMTGISVRKKSSE